MAVFRVERTKNYTVMSNYHLRDMALSLKAKGLLSMMLSMPEDWDYSTRGLAAICKEGVESISSALKELEKAGYIIRTQLRDVKGRITDTEYVIFEQPQQTAPAQEIASSPAPESSPSANAQAASPNTQASSPNTLPPHPENPYLDATPALDFAPISDTAPPVAPLPPTADAGKGLPKASAVLRQGIKAQIEYDCLQDQYNQRLLDELVEIMLEVYATDAAVIKVAGGQYPAELVKDRFRQISSTHIERILAGLRENTTKVHNTKAYLLSALFNGPVTTDAYYLMQVRHDQKRLGLAP